MLRALAGEQRADRERALVPDPEMQLLFALLLGTGMRLREAYRLRVGQIDLVGRALRPQASKAWRGRVKHRGIPLQPHLQTSVAAYLAARPAAGPDALLFSFWDGDPLTLKRATSRLSARFAALFDYAGLVDITQHDLRHEATCRWYEMRRPDGVPLYREAEINRIMGWAPGSRMAARYASFRAEDLAARLYLAQDQAA